MTLILLNPKNANIKRYYSLPLEISRSTNDSKYSG